ncbi:hypothetical protein EJ04DRAFT_535373 [Polyplosphaeria fusca]|uniref:Uncharacterized protein n=1 Tax=Polyplosphaeria fusca TaxID=682080 RepID=A0A9P4QYN0_9PLEO|nr:hypothetical protein EJ04DRAFT_535373 [Polyplosphaeria fusca]
MRLPLNKATLRQRGSNPSLSDASALIPTSVPDEDTELSDVDSESRLSESSEEPSSDSSSDDDDDADSDLDMDDEQGIVNLRANQGKKPKMKLAKEDLGDELIPFLKDFLPQLKKANDELHARRQAGTLKHDEIELDGEGEGQYIEMDLGLGVLEEKDPNARSLSEDDSGEKTADSSGATTEKDILGKLMGCDRTKDEPGIVEVCDKAAT